MENNSKIKSGHALKFTINGKHHESSEQYITGGQLRKLGDIPNDHECYLTVPKPWKNELIADDDRVNLARPEVEHFISLEREVKLTLMVNSKPKEWGKNTISFEEVVILAFGSYDPNPDKVYTVTYDRGPKHNPEGTMVKGDSVFTKNKMIFNVTATDKS